MSSANHIAWFGIHPQATTLSLMVANAIIGFGCGSLSFITRLNPLAPWLLAGLGCFYGAGLAALLLHRPPSTASGTHHQAQPTPRYAPDPSHASQHAVADPAHAPSYPPSDAVHASASHTADMWGQATHDAPLQARPGPSSGLINLVPMSLNVPSPHSDEPSGSITVDPRFRPTPDTNRYALEAVTAVADKRYEEDAAAFTERPKTGPRGVIPESAVREHVMIKGAQRSRPELVDRYALEAVTALAPEPPQADAGRPDEADASPPTRETRLAEPSPGLNPKKPDATPATGRDNELDGWALPADLD